jgi:flavin-dependent dehydrogenase
VATQEHEFFAGAEAVARARAGRDGEPEILLHADLGGYSWNVPKGEWLNVGTGTSEPRQVLPAWAGARSFFANAGHLPESAQTELDGVKGHSYHLFDPAHLAGCEKDGLLIVGDALGLAHPLTAEGIMPAVLSGHLAAEAVLAGQPSGYRRALEGHPLMRDYALARELLLAGIALNRRFGQRAARIPALPGASRVAAVAHAALVKGFARMFSGEPIPYAALLRALLQGARSLTEARAR